MRIGPYEFRPALWPSLATLLLLPLLIGLGKWQLDRAAWKQELIDTHAARIAEPARPLPEVLAEPSGEQEYRQVTVQGVYDLGHQLLLDNQVHDGVAGYHVLTPLQLDGVATADDWVLVNRGWVPVGASRSRLPAVAGPAGPVTVRAMLRLPPARTFRLEAVEEPVSGWPQVIQEVEMGPIEKRLGRRLRPLVLLLDPGEAGGFVRDWKPVYGITPDRHRAYAAQWFTLALVLLVIYVGVNTRRRDPQTGGH
jgi:surfeit locus 1 family protein